MQIFLRLFVAVAFLAIGYYVSTSMFNEDKKPRKKRSAEQKYNPKEQADGKSSRGLQKREKNDFRKTSKSGANVQFKSQTKQTTVNILSPTDYQVYLQTQGIVKARTETKLNALVSGKIHTISEQLQDGAFFKKGDLLLQIDPSDYASQIITAEANLARAQSNLAQEQARAAQALRNWQDIGFDEEPNELVLRKPQLKEAKANVAAQMANIERAQRNLSRTKVYAPYDGRVRERKIGPGESIGNNTTIAEIYATDFAEIRLPLSSRQLVQIDLNEQENLAIPVDLTDAINNENTTIWPANIQYVEGELDEVSRELFVIANISDPFGKQTGNPPLRINQPVRAKVQGRIIKNAYIIDRKHLYNADEILLVEKDVIVRKSIDILWSTPDHVITIDPTLKDKFLSSSRMNHAKTGTPVEIIPSEADPAANNTSSSDLTPSKPTLE